MLQPLRTLKTARKLQSAMEYLMTYGWAILIIAVVLGALFQLGVFNSSSFSPRAPPGACQVFRPSGPGTTTNINLMGVCTGQLPQYVTIFKGSSDSYIGSIPDGSFPSGSNPVSIFAWIKSTQNVYAPFVVQYGNSGTNYQNWILEYANGHACVDSWGTGTCVGALINDGNWHFIGFTYSSGTSATVYIDGVGTAASWSGTPAVNTLSGTSGRIGYGYTNYYSGSIANAQIYNTTLTANQIQALYLEGIGGAPMKLQNLVGWWPLNGNSNDYSGNNNNGVPANVAFTSQYGK